MRPRVFVRWEARCNTRDRMCTGVLRDVNDHGGFFEVEHDEAAVARKPLAEGDAILVRYVAEPNTHWTTMRAVVRWVGSSLEHECAGIGFEFSASASF